MPGRLRRTKSWQDREDLSPLAQITVLEHGGHARPIITRGGKHLRSRMGSRKTGLQQIGEGRAHRDLIMLNEVSPEVIDYQAFDTGLGEGRSANLGEMGEDCEA